MHRIGKRVKALREQRGLTQAELGHAIWTSRATVARLEAGAVPSVPLLALLADFFDVNLLFLIGMRSTPERGLYLTDREAAVLESFRMLSPKGQLMALQSLSDLIDFEKIRAKP